MKWKRTKPEYTVRTQEQTQQNKELKLREEKKKQMNSKREENKDSQYSSTNQNWKVSYVVLKSESKGKILQSYNSTFLVMFP